MHIIYGSHTRDVVFVNSESSGFFGSWIFFRCLGTGSTILYEHGKGYVFSGRKGVGGVLGFNFLCYECADRRRQVLDNYVSSRVTVILDKIMTRHLLS